MSKSSGIIKQDALTTIFGESACIEYGLYRLSKKIPGSIAWDNLVIGHGDAIIPLQGVPKLVMALLVKSYGDIVAPTDVAALLISGNFTDLSMRGAILKIKTAASNQGIMAVADNIKSAKRSGIGYTMAQTSSYFLNAPKPVA